jgi:hypothetical protein
MIVVALAAAIMAVTVGVTASSAGRLTHVQSGSAVVITGSGSDLWNFEALLQSTFKQKQPCIQDLYQGAINFPLANNDCTPLATYSPYFYTFKKLAKSSFHETDFHFVSGDAGWHSNAAPIHIAGNLIACNSSDSQVLVEWSGSESFSLGCISTQSAVG